MGGEKYENPELVSLFNLFFSLSLDPGAAVATTSLSITMAMPDATTHPLLQDLLTQVASAISDELTRKVVPARLPLNDAPPIEPLPKGTVVVEAASGKIVPAPVALANRVVVKKINYDFRNQFLTLSVTPPAPFQGQITRVLRYSLFVDNYGNVLVEYNVAGMPSNYVFNPVDGFETVHVYVLRSTRAYPPITVGLLQYLPASAQSQQLKKVQVSSEDLRGHLLAMSTAAREALIALALELSQLAMPNFQKLEAEWKAQGFGVAEPNAVDSDAKADGDDAPAAPSVWQTEAIACHRSMAALQRELSLMHDRLQAARDEARRYAEAAETSAASTRAALEADRAARAEAAEALATARAEAAKTLAAARAETLGSTARTQTLETELHLQRQLQEAAGAQSALDRAERNTTRAEYDALLADLGALQQRLGSPEARRAEILELERDKARAELTEAKETVDKLLASVRSASTRATAQQQLVETSTVNAVQECGRADNERRRADRLQSELEEAQRQAAALVEKSSDAAITSLGQQVDQLRDQLDTERERTVAVERERDSLHVQLRRIQEFIGQTKTR
jgi:hypothetical protein